MKARLTLALSLLADAADNFARGSTVFDSEAFGHARRVPIRLVHDIVRLLCRGELLVEVSSKSGRFTLQRTPDKIRVQEIFDLLMQDGTAPAPLGLSNNLHPAVARALEAWSDGGIAALGTKTLSELVAPAAGP
jgi:DNA-binding IscR family transcriptional regulator